MKMIVRARAVFLALTVLFQVSLAQFGPDQRWLTPDGSKADFTSSYAAGDTITLSWQTLNASKSDLWLTHWNSTVYPWHYQVAASVDISKAGTLSWYIDVPASTIQYDTHFVLRFYPLGSAYTVLQFVQLASPGMIITGGTTNSSSTSSSSSSSSSASKTSTSVSSSPTVSTATTTNAGSPTGTGVSGSSQTTAASSSSGLSVASQAGIGVGAGLFVIVLFVAGCFFGRRFGMGKNVRRSDRGLEGEVFPMHESNSAPYSDSHYSASEMGTSKAQRSDKGDTAALISSPTTDDYHGGKSWAEMSGSYIQPIEKSGSMIRPGVHELG